MLSHSEVKAALACPVEVTGGAVVPSQFTTDFEGKLRVCGHAVVAVRPERDGVTRCTCKRCQYSWRVFHPPGTLERDERNLARIIARARRATA